MTYDLEMISNGYSQFEGRVNAARTALGRPLTYAEKVLFSHLDSAPNSDYSHGKTYINFNPDRVAMQDATAQMALLQFLQAGKSQVSVPSTVHCDHLILAEEGADSDLVASIDRNKEVYDFLSSVAKKYGIGFWAPGSGIIHQVVLENYAFPGGMMIGTDSHTVNAGGLGMIAIGVGGADAVDVLVGMPWELKLPKLIGVKLTGSLSGWASAKDVILKLAGILTVKGGTDSIVEYFGPGAESLSCTGKGTICNMGAEIGATTSIFPYDAAMGRYLRETRRSDVADLCDGMADQLQADPEVLADPDSYYHQVIEIDLSTLEPYINGPFTPDKAWPISEFAKAVESEGFPRELEVGLIGSCTNSSYEDLDRAASVARQAGEKNLKVKSEFTVTPGSEMVRYTVERDGLLADFEQIGGVILANACGPCIGQWKRHRQGDQEKNSIITSFNRNFAKRNDGNPNTYAFVASPEIVTALAIAGDLCFNPLTDTLTNEQGEDVRLDPPTGAELPSKGFDVEDAGFVPPSSDTAGLEVTVSPSSDRLQLLAGFPPFSGQELTGMRLLIKAQGKCTTDHISMAGPWLKFRGHLDNISNNMLIGAVNAFNGDTNSVFNMEKKSYLPVPDSARAYKAANVGTIVVGDENYGEGSSREHAAMEPRHMGVMAVIVKSFARIHETNLKKQGVLAFTFRDKSDYDKIQERDVVSLKGIVDLAPSSEVRLRCEHEDGSVDEIHLDHTYNQIQIDWFKAGSALNKIREKSNS
ncbi:MAG: aconitate hydratase [Actinobacteria bacterium]|nr:aconitate hydratase [Actinomycetota bacterium]